MKKIPIRSVYGETFCHESESIEKVKKAFELFFPKKVIKQETQPGMYGTKIKILKAKLEKRKARELFEKIINSLTDLEKKQILNEINLRLSDEGKLYLRFDKQDAFNEKISLAEESGDTIQIVFSLEAYPATKVNFVKTAKELFTKGL